MKSFVQYALAVLILILGFAALFFGLTIFCIILGVVALLTVVGSIPSHFRKQKFWHHRGLAKEAVVRLQTTVHLYEHDVVLREFAASANCGSELANALANASRFATNMNEWILMICGYFNRGCLPDRGLQMAQVASKVDAVNSELIRSYRWLTEGRNGPAPAILASDWYDLEHVFPGCRDLYGTNFRAV
jgi:hypothetical protein